MELRQAHYELLNALIDDMEPLDQIVSMTETPLAPRQAVDLLLELQRYGPVTSAVLVDLKTWRQPRPDDFERAIAELEDSAERPRQSDLWFRLTEMGQAEWRSKYGERDPSEMWRIAETDDLLEVSAVSPEVATSALASWQQRHPKIALEQLRTRTPAPFTLNDGTRVEPGILLTFRRRPSAGRRS